MQMGLTAIEILEARRWLMENCHHADLRHVLQRGLEYFEAISKAGLCTQSTSGEDLYTFLSDASVAAARSRSFVQPTL